jgi:UDPglucose 6-dehydrogenase
MELLWEAGASVRAFDPEARAETQRLYGDRADLVLCDDAMEAVQGADVLAVVTEWKAFRSPDFAAVRGTLAEPAIFDGRNLYDPAVVEEAGLAYYGIGRGRSLQWSP